MQSGSEEPRAHYETQTERERNKNKRNKNKKRQHDDKRNIKRIEAESCKCFTYIIPDVECYQGTGFSQTTKTNKLHLTSVGKSNVVVQESEFLYKL